MKQWTINYTENGHEKVTTQLHQEDMYIDDVYLSFDNSEIEIQHIELVCQAEKTGYTVTEDMPYTVYKDGKTFSKGFNDITSCLHSIWTAEGKVQRDFYLLHDGVVFKGVAR